MQGEMTSKKVIKTGFVFGKAQSFDEAFPDIKKIEIHIKQSDSDFMNRYNKNTLPAYIKCNNSQCYSGRLDIGSILSFMITKKERYKKGTELCAGIEGLPRSKYRRRCFNIFHYEIIIEYKDNKNE
jgi:hypothetical protein